MNTATNINQLTIDGVELAYVEQGTGDPIVLIHGAGGQIEAWLGVMDELSAGHRVIAYDRRGYGRSTHRPVRDFRIHVRDAAALVEQVAGGPATLVGWSSGANLAIALAVEHQDLVRALVLVEPPFHGMRYVSPAFLRLAARANVALLRRRPRVAAELFLRWVGTYETGGTSFDTWPEDDRELVLGNAAAMMAEVAPHPFGALIEHIPLRVVAGICAPITYLRGDLSNPWFHRIHARMVAAVPSIRTVRIPDAGHFLPKENPAAFAAAVRIATITAGPSRAVNTEPAT